jgi:uncharacterized protein (PEP-CTERM system associated)
VNLGSAYDVLFVQYAAREPDPDKRKALVEALLAEAGIDPQQQLLADFLSSSLTLQRSDGLALSWSGVRSTMTLSLARSAIRRADTLFVPAGGDDFATSSVIRQSGGSLTFSHRLSPAATLGVDASVRRVSGSAASQRSSVRSLGLTWGLQLGRRASVSVGARHFDADSPTLPYQASVLTASARLEF